MGWKTLTEARKAVTDDKGCLIGRLLYHTSLKHKGSYNNVSLQSDNARTKHKIRATISTNGLAMHLLVYDTSKIRYTPRGGHSSSGDGGSSVDGDDDQGEDDSDLIGLEDEEFVLDDAFMDDDESQGETEEGEDEGEVEEGEAEEDEVEGSEVEEGEPSSRKRKRQAASPATSDQEFTRSNINWKRSSKMLENVEVAFATRQQCPPHNTTVVIGIDPGEVKTATATRIDPSRPNERHSVTITRKFLYRPYAQFRRLLETRKKMAGIDVIEANMPPRTIEGIGQYLTYMQTNRQQLHAFYDSTWYLRKVWDARKAQQAAIDLGIKAFIRMAGGDESHQKQAGVSVVFSVGLGSFNTRTGLPSKHGAFLKAFIIKVSCMLMLRVIFSLYSILKPCFLKNK
jgi:hypothetical protein